MTSDCVIESWKISFHVREFLLNLSVIMGDNSQVILSKHFANSCEFKLRTSSPHYPQANGEMENAVKTAKRILRQSDTFRALIRILEYANSSYRSQSHRINYGKENKNHITFTP